MSIKYNMIVSTEEMAELTLFLTSRLAWDSRSCFTTSEWPPSTARWRGVSPSCEKSIVTMHLSTSCTTYPKSGQILISIGALSQIIYSSILITDMKHYSANLQRSCQHAVMKLRIRITTGMHTCIANSIAQTWAHASICQITCWCHESAKLSHQARKPLRQSKAI